MQNSTTLGISRIAPSAVIALMTATMITPTQSARAFLANTGYWRLQNNSLKYSTSTQSVYAGNCSGIVTVKTYNPSGTLTNVTSNLTVNLSGAGTTTFYSDPNCSNAISNVTVASGSNSANFYFIDTSTSTITVTAAATSYTSALQSETIGTNPFVWTGGGGNANWSTAANWSGGSAPGASNTALFDGTCSSNCSPTIAASINVGGVRMASGYGGTITQSSGQSITLNSQGWVQFAGTFVGSSTASDTITVNGPMVLNGGSFKSTSGKLYSYGNSYTVGGSMTFLANSGEVIFASAGGGNISVTTGTVTYQKVTFGGFGSNFNLNNSTMTIAGDLSLTASGGQYISTGQLKVAGNVTATGARNSDSESIVLTGNPAGQTLSTSGGGYISNLEIATGANPVTFSGTVTIQNSFKVTSAGTVTTTGSTLIFSRSFGTLTIAPGSVAYNNIQIINYMADTDFGGATMTINGNLTLGNGGAADGGNFNNGTLNIGGDLTTLANTLISGSALYRLVGNASGQTVTSNGTTAGVGNLEIAAGTQNVTFGSAVTVTGNYTLTSVGTLNAASSTLSFLSSSANIKPGTVTYNNVQFLSAWGGSTYDLGSSTFNIGGNLTFNSGGYLIAVNSGTLSVAKNVTSSGSIQIGGSASLQFTGSSNQTVTSTGGSGFPAGNVTVNKSTSTLTLGSNLSITAPGQTLTIQNGTVDMHGFNLSASALTMTAGTITLQGAGAAPGILTVNGVVQSTGAYQGGNITN